MGSLIEIIGSIVAFIFLFIFFLRQFKPLEEEEEEGDERIHVAKKSKKAQKAIVPPQVFQKPAEPVRGVKRETYQVKHMEEKPSQGAVIIRKLDNPREMFIIQEIIGPPKGSNNF